MAIQQLVTDGDGDVKLEPINIYLVFFMFTSMKFWCDWLIAWLVIDCLQMALGVIERTSSRCNLIYFDFCLHSCGAFGQLSSAVFAFEEGRWNAVLKLNIFEAADEMLTALMLFLHV